MGVRIEELGPDDPRWEAWQDQLERGRTHERPWESVPSLASSRAWAAQPVDDRMVPYVAVEDGPHGDRVVGAGFAVVNLAGNTHFGWADVAVAPELRRRGTGTAMVRHAEDVVRAAGARSLLLSTSYPFEERETHGYRRFVESCGYALDLDEAHRVLRLPVDPALLDRLAAEAARAHEGYRIVTWVHDVPEEHLAGWVHCHNQLGPDAPQGVVVFEEDGMTEESWRTEAERLRALGREVTTTVALSPGGEVVAYNDLVLQDNGTGRVSQWGTLVRRDHRGHRLGLAVKVAGLADLARRHPDRTEVHTTNAEVNDHMIAINAALGFDPVAVHGGFHRTL